MAHNKYEIRDVDAQEIMRKPPPAFVAKGNVLILLVLSAAFYFLNEFTIYERETIHFEITDAASKKNHADSARVALLSTDGISKKVKRGQRAELYIANPAGHINGYLGGRIDSIGYTPYGAPMIYFRSAGSGLFIQSGMIGHIDVFIKKKTFLSMLLERFRI